MKLPINPRYKPPETGSGDLGTYVIFYGKKSTGPEPNQSSGKEVFTCTAEVYKPSMKDLEIMKVNGTKKGMTIKIRDPQKDYIPSNEHRVFIDDYRFEGIEWNITDVRPDIQNNKFITILLGASS